MQLKVRDFGVWKSAFDDQEPVRWWHGVQRQWLYRSADDPDDVLVALAFPTPEQGRAFLEAPDLRETMQRGEVIGKPRIHFCEPVSAPSTDRPRARARRSKPTRRLP